MIAEQQLRDVLDILSGSSIVGLDKIIYFSKEHDEHKVSNLHRHLSINELVEALLINGDVEKDHQLSPSELSSNVEQLQKQCDYLLQVANDGGFYPPVSMERALNGMGDD